MNVELAVVSQPSVDVAELVAGRIAASYRLACAILLDPGEAEDAVQEASLAAWRRRSSLREPDRFDVWFERIVVNQCRDQLRRRKRRPWAATTTSIERSSRASELPVGADPDLEAALQRLDFDHRLVVVMRYWQDRTVQDIADRLAIPLGTVKSRLHYALRDLRVDLEDRDGRV